MKVLIYDAHNFEIERFNELNSKYHHELTFINSKLNEDTIKLAEGYTCICAFVNDKLDANTLQTLKNSGVKLIALRSAGFNHVDLSCATKLGIKVVRVPEYSPYSVAEFTMTLIMALNRKIHKSYNRVREGNFSLEGLVGFDLHGKTVGVIGTGKIGKVFIKILRGFGCNVLAFDLTPDKQFALDHHFEYRELDFIYQNADIISLHVPLNTATFHMINEQTMMKLKKNVMIINTGRGALIDTKALIKALKTGQIGSAGLDVFEEESQYFFEDMSEKILDNEMLIRLMTFPNVILTSHQAFLTNEALNNIADITLDNIKQFQEGVSLSNALN